MNDDEPRKLICLWLSGKLNRTFHDCAASNNVDPDRALTAIIQNFLDPSPEQVTVTFDTHEDTYLRTFLIPDTLVKELEESAQRFACHRNQIVYAALQNHFDVR